MSRARWHTHEVARTKLDNLLLKQKSEVAGSNEKGFFDPAVSVRAVSRVFAVSQWRAPSHHVFHERVETSRIAAKDHYPALVVTVPEGDTAAGGYVTI